MCLKGLPAKCINGGVFGCGPMLGDLNGSQAEYIRVPHAQFGMHKIPESLTDEQALMVGDILSTGYFAVINLFGLQRRLQPDDRRAVIPIPD